MSGALDAFRLDGRVALVTGAAGGIGRATALVLARAGAHVVAADVDEARLADTKQALGAGGEVQLLDVSSRSEVEALVEGVVARHGRLDVAAHVAGILRVAPLLELEEAELDAVLAVNLKGVLFGCQATARAMVAQGSGAIVNIASSAAFETFPGHGAYTVSKLGVVGLTRVLAAEVAGAGVRVNAVAPGMIDTPMAGRRFRSRDGSQTPEQREAMLADARTRNPLRIVGRPEDVANAVLYLASDAARYVTGQVLHPNGGRPMA